MDHKPVKLIKYNQDLLLPSLVGGEQLTVGIQLQPGPDEEVSAVLGAEIQQVRCTPDTLMSVVYSFYFRIVSLMLLLLLL